MKKWISACLVLAVLAGAAVPAAAAADQRLTQVTLSVKQTLGLGDDYGSFYGELEENEFRTLWTLNWEGEGESLRVMAGEDGTIYYLNRSRTDGTSSDSTPAFPALSREEARALAQAFLDRVVPQPWGTDLSEDEGGQTLWEDSYRFSTQLLLHGVTTPVGVSVTVDGTDGAVLRYSRDDRYEDYVGEPADPETLDLNLQTAEAPLKGTLELRLEYVLQGEDRAVLRYLPEPIDEYYVDAVTGELVDLTELYDQMWAQDNGLGSGGTSEAPAAGESAADSSLSDAEQAGIAQLEGVLDQSALDRAARAVAGLGLGTRALASCTYQLDRETGEVTAQLRYTGGENTSRTLTLDGRTGALLGVSGVTWGTEDFVPTLTAEQARARAEQFLQALWPEQFGRCGLYEITAAQAGDGRLTHTFRFVQKEGDYFFPTNSITIAIDAADGSVARLSRSFEADPAFDDPQGLIDAQTALDAWFGTYEVKLGYLAVPRALADLGGEYAPLMELGYTYLYSLQLGFYLEQPDYALGVDAKTGQPVYPETADSAMPVYSDLEGSWGRAQAEALAAYGVGWLGGVLEPDKTLTQSDALALLVSTQGYLADPEDPESLEQVYEMAYSMGLLTRADRAEDRTVTRGELVKLLLDWAGYGKTASIPGIFRCSFADQASIPAELYGYAAIAQGLGVVSGDSAGNFSAQRAATRLEAVVMLYQLLKA